MSQIIPDGQLAKPNRQISLADIVAPVAHSIQSVNELLLSEISSSNQILTERLACSGIGGGKRMRPALLLISGACFGDIKKTHVAAAAAIEMFHVATLVHDDVLDGATERRHIESLNSKWNNTTSILTGDFLFTRAMEIGCRSRSIEAVSRMASACSIVTEGEITQNAMVGNFEITQSLYTEMVAAKTAELCKCACGLGALLSECDDDMVARFEQYGEDIGIAFQIIDDVLDLIGDEAVVGKTLGTDLVNKKATLPLILCLKQLDSTERKRWIEQLNDASWNLEEILELLIKTGSIEQAREHARSRCNRALNFASSLKPSIYSNALVQLANFVIERID